MKKMFCCSILMTLMNNSYANQALGNIEYDERGLPIVNVIINSNSHKLMLDTGSGMGLHIIEESLFALISDAKYQAKKEKPYKSSDIDGNIKLTETWTLQNLTVSEGIFNDVGVVKLEPWGWSVGDNLPESEVMGLGLFDKRIMLMDFKNNFLGLLSELPGNISEWEAYSLKDTSAGLVISALKGKNNLSFILDTGASYSFIFSESIPKNTSVYGCDKIEPKALPTDCDTTAVLLTNSDGNKKEEFAYIIDTPKHDEFDGLIGMSFLRGRETILDRHTSTLYIRR